MRLTYQLTKTLRVRAERRGDLFAVWCEQDGGTRYPEGKRVWLTAEPDVFVGRLAASFPLAAADRNVSWGVILAVAVHGMVLWLVLSGLQRIFGG